MPPVGTRITIEPEKCGGKPCIRGLRITVWDVLGWLGAGMTEQEILDEHPTSRKPTSRPSIITRRKLGAKLTSGEAAASRRERSRSRTGTRQRQAYWNWARENDFAVITADSDFLALSQSFGWPPKIIHLEQCDFPLRVIEGQLRRNAVRIVEFHKNEDAGVLTLRFAPASESG
jgi:predicted nuclease of predicted toxin-antitoxin system